MPGKNQQLLTHSEAATANGAAPPTPTGRGQRLRHFLAANTTWWALLAALLLAALYGRVALLNLNLGVVGGDDDGYENLWNDYWVRTGLLELKRNPLFFTDYIYYPTGISLRFHTLNPLNGLFAIPLWPLMGSVAATNFKFILSMALTVFCGYLLIKDLTGQALAAFAGAALFTFANDLLIGYFSLGQAEKLSAWWFPLYWWLVLRALNRPGWKRYAAGAIVVLTALSLTDWQYVMLAVIVTLGYFGFVLAGRRNWREKRAVFGKLSLIGVGWSALVIGPFVLPMIAEAAQNPWLAVSEQAAYRARTLVEFVQPVGTANPGYLALGLTAGGLWWWWKSRPPLEERRTVLFWAGAAALASVVALGPRLIIFPLKPAATPLPGEITDIPLPYALLQRLPVLSIGRDPGRFYLIAMLGFGILFAFGWRQILGWIQARPEAAPAKSDWWRGQAGLVLTALVVGITLAGFVAEAGKAQVDPPDWPPFYEQLAQDPEKYAIMELPLFAAEKGRGENTYQAYQIIHGKPRMGGRWARDHKLSNPNNFAKRATLFRDFFWLHERNRIEEYRPNRPDIVTPPDYSQWSLPLLNFYNIRYIMLYPEALQATAPGAENAAMRMVRTALGAGVKPAYEDSKLRAYRVPAGSPPANPLFIDLGSEGWYATENTSGEPHRYANTCNNNLAEKTRRYDTCNQAVPELLVFNLSQTRQKADLRFTLITYKIPHRINVAINGYNIGSYQMEGDASREVSITGLEIPPGLNSLTFSSPEPGTPVDSPDDARLLSFGLKQVSLK